MVLLKHYMQGHIIHLNKINTRKFQTHVEIHWGFKSNDSRNEMQIFLYFMKRLIVDANKLLSLILCRSCILQSQ